MIAFGISGGLSFGVVVDPVSSAWEPEAIMPISEVISIFVSIEIEVCKEILRLQWSWEGIKKFVP